MRQDVLFDNPQYIKRDTFALQTQSSESVL